MMNARRAFFALAILGLAVAARAEVVESTNTFTARTVQSNLPLVGGPFNISNFQSVYYKIQLSTDSVWNDPTLNVTMDPQHLDGANWVSDGPSTWVGGTLNHGGSMPLIAIGYTTEQISQVRVIVSVNKNATLGAVVYIRLSR